MFQSALRFAVLPDSTLPEWAGYVGFQSALRFAVLPDDYEYACRHGAPKEFQSALRFAVLPDNAPAKLAAQARLFQSALRFAVLPDLWLRHRPRLRPRFNPL